MPNRQQFDNQINSYFSGNYNVISGTVIPEVANVTLGKYAKEIDLAMLFVDLRETTRIVSGSLRQTAAKMYKSFLWGIAKIATENSGQLRSFNGDGVLVVFIGPQKCNMAVKAAMQMSFFVSQILKPKVDSYLSANNQLRGMELDFGIGIDTGPVFIVRGGIRGDNNNDLVWVGNATNFAVKLANLNIDKHIRITPAVYRVLSNNNKFVASHLGLQFNMWEQALLFPRPTLPFLYVTNRPSQSVYYKSNYHRPF